MADPSSKAPSRRALLSVTRKEGLDELARGLLERGFELAASGGTARFLGEHGIAYRAVSDITGQPEILGGRVKTLHPVIHAGILARRSHPDDLTTLAQQEILPVDVVAVNFYPFEETLASGAGPDVIRENIDIGGPCLVRAAAKNWPDVLVAVDPADYPAVLEALDAGASSAPARRKLAAKAFEATADYESRIAGWFAAEAGTRFPPRFLPSFERVSTLRYGENPHQTAALYRDPDAGGRGIPFGNQLGGRELSYNNILDLDAALRAVADLASLGEAAAVVIKHLNPAGAAVGATLAEAYAAARATDPVSAFGGIVGLSRPVDEATAEELAKTFLEAIVAPGFEPEALSKLKRKRKLRLIETGALEDFRPCGPHLTRVAGGLLVQDWDRMGEDDGGGFRVVTRREPTDEERTGLRFAWRVARHVRSNAIVIARETKLLGVGAGQMSRLDSCRLAVEKAQVPVEGAVAASDAFFPFRDGPDSLAAAGIRAIIQPGGSVRDEEVIAAADEQGMAMMFTGIRHFRH